MAKQMKSSAAPFFFAKEDDSTSSDSWKRQYQDIRSMPKKKALRVAESYETPVDNNLFFTNKPKREEILHTELEVPDERGDSEQTTPLCDFTSYTTIHGFKNVAETEMSGVRSIWIFMIVLSFAGLSWQITHLMTNFTDEPTATVLINDVPKTYPVMIFCPYYWYNQSALDRYGVDAELLSYLHSILFRSLYSKDNRVKTENAPIAVKSRRSLQVIINQHANGSIDRLFELLALSAGSFVELGGRAGKMGDVLGSLLKIKYHITTNGICIKIDLLLPLSRMSVASMRLQLWIHRPPNVELLDDDANTLSMGDTADTVLPMGEINLEQDAHYVIAMAHSRVKHVYLRKKPCNMEGHFRDMTLCHMTCFRELCVNASACVPFIPTSSGSFDSRFQIDRICSYYNTLPTSNLPEHCSFNMAAMEKYNDTCTDERCPIPCKSTTYELSASSFTKRKHTNYSEIYLRFADPMNRYYIKEKAIYDGQTMVSNIGGAIGLWCGGSIISLIEILYFFSCRQKFLKKKRELMKKLKSKY